MQGQCQKAAVKIKYIASKTTSLLIDDIHSGYLLLLYMHIWALQSLCRADLESVGMHHLLLDTGVT